MDNIELTQYGRRRDQVVGGENVTGEESDDGPSVAAAVDYEQIPDDSPSTIAGPLPIDDEGGPTADDKRPIKCPSLPCGRSRQPIGLSSDDGEGISSDDVYTVEDAIDRLGFGPFQIIITIFSGVLSMADAMEVMLLSVLSPIVACEWNLENYQQSMITSVVFIGFFFGALFWGAISDVIGRKKVLICVSTLILIFGVASAAAPEYYTLLLLRCLAGFGIGGTTQSVTYFVEFLTKSSRGPCMVMLNFWWGIGSLVAALLALVIIPNIHDEIYVPQSNYSTHINWRVYLLVCALPMILVLTFYIFIPESARYYIIQGKIDKGEKVIARIAHMNFKSPPPGRLVSQEEKERLKNLGKDYKKGSGTLTNVISTGSTYHSTEEVDDKSTTPLLKASIEAADDDMTHQEEKCFCLIALYKNIQEGFYKMKNDIPLLFTNGMWKTSALLFFIWIGCAWLYYGSILLGTTILETGYDPHCGRTNQSVNATACRNLTTDFYLKIVWTTTAEFPGTIITLVIIELIGRKFTIGTEFTLTGLFYGLLMICVPEAWLTVFLYGARAFAAGVFQAVYVYTPEVFPTKIRGIGMGVMTSAARIGALITPFIAQSLFPVSDYATLILYCGSAIILAVLALLLPIETKGRSLKDTKG